MLLIVADGALHTIEKGNTRLPSQSPDLARVDAVLKVIVESIGDEFAIVSRINVIAAEMIGEEMGDLHDTEFIGSSDVVDLGDCSLLEDGVDALADVIYIDKIATRVAIPMDGHLLALLEERDKTGDELLGVLPGAIDIVPPHNDDG